MKPETWLRRAMRRKTDKPYRAELCQYHCEDGWTVTTDGRRVHAMHVDLGKGEAKGYPVWQDQFKVPWAVKGRISKDHFRAVCENALAFQNDGKGERPNPKDEGVATLPLRLEFRDITVESTFFNPRLGGGGATIRNLEEWNFDHRNKRDEAVVSFQGELPCKVEVDPSFVVDALWGMDEIVEVRISPEYKRIMLRSPESPKLEAETWAVIALMQNVR